MRSFLDLLGVYLRVERNKLGLTQLEMSKRLNINAQTLRRIEQSDPKSILSIVDKIAKNSNITSVELMKKLIEMV